MFCSKHPTKELDLYCETCEELVCRDCTVRIHRDHQYDLVTDAFQKHKDVLVASLQPVEQQLDTVTKSLQQLDTQCQQITDQRETLVGNIHKTIRQLQEALEVRKTELIGQLDQITQRKLKTLAAQKDQIELVQTQLSSCLDFVKESLRTGSEGEILAMKKPVVKQVEEITAEFKAEVLVPTRTSRHQVLSSKHSRGHPNMPAVWPGLLPSSLPREVLCNRQGSGGSNSWRTGYCNAVCHRCRWQGIVNSHLSTPVVN